MIQEKNIDLNNVRTLFRLNVIYLIGWFFSFFLSFFFNHLKFDWQEMGYYLLISLFIILLTFSFIKKGTLSPMIKYGNGLVVFSLLFFSTVLTASAVKFLLINVLIILLFLEIITIFLLGYFYEIFGIILFNVFVFFYLAILFFLLKSVVFVQNIDLFLAGFILIFVFLNGIIASLIVSRIQKSFFNIEIKTQKIEEEKFFLKKELNQITDNFQKELKEKTSALQQKIDELEKIQKLTIGRELKMAELKQEIERLKKNT